MENDQKISNQVWKIYKSFKGQDKTYSAWDLFIEQGKAIASKYQGADKALAEDMFLAFVAYLEKQGV